MNEIFVLAAHRRALFEELVRVLRADYSADEGDIKKKLICSGKIFMGDREVTDASVQTVINDLLKMQKHEEDLLSEFEFTRKDKTDEQQAPPAQGRQPKQQPKRKGGAAAAEPGARRGAVRTRRSA